jgi:type IV pilus assembly protein PilQ
MKKKQLATIIAGITFSAGALAANTLDSFSYNNISDDKTVVQIDFEKNISLGKDVSVVKINNNLNLRFRDASSSLSFNNYKMDQWGTARITSDQEDLVLNLELDMDAKYNLVTENDKVMVILERSERVINNNSFENVEKLSPSDAVITNIDFERENKGASQIEVTFKNKVRYETIEETDKFRMVIYGAKLPSKLFRSIDVADFDTPVERFVSRVENGNVIVDVHYKEGRKVDTVFTKVGDKLVLLSSDKKMVNEDKSYAGYLVDFDFQEIPLKNTIQSLAETMKMNVVLSENISGVLTLKLNKVPYDEALNAILEAKDLGMKKTGNVTYIAPLDELHERAKYKLESETRINELTPLSTFSWEVKYAKASDVAGLMSGITTERGEVTFDERTNRIMIKDIPRKIKEVQNRILELDVPLRQVVVESRIVLTKRSNGSGFGITWGAQNSENTNGGVLTVGGGGNGLINLGLSNPTSNLAIGFLNSTTSLDLALSAMENNGNAEILSRPKIITSDKKTGVIETGQQYPFNQVGENGISGTQFEDVTLKLEVTPTITPDDKIMMELDIQQESLAQLTQNGPAIDTSSIKTEILANDGETIVLGGIYKTDILYEESKVPLLGDIPFLGKLFTRQSEREEQFELLIFITPKLFENEVIN